MTRYEEQNCLCITCKKEHSSPKFIHGCYCPSGGYNDRISIRKSGFCPMRKGKTCELVKECKKYDKI